jgi:hypothetical protein
MLEPRGHGPFIPVFVVVIEISVDVANTGLQNPPQACGISIQVPTASQSAYSAAQCWSSVARAVSSPQPHHQTPSSQLKCTRQFTRHSIVMALMGWFVLVSYFLCFSYMRAEACHVYPLKHLVRDISPGACWLVLVALSILRI